LIWLVYTLRTVLTPVFFAFLIAYMLDPVVDRLESWGIPRAGGIAILLTIVLGSIAAFLVFAVPGMVRELIAFVSELPDKTERLIARHEPTLREYGIEPPHNVQELLEQIDLSSEHMPSPWETMKTLAGGAARAVAAVVAALIVPILAFYLLYDFDRMIAAIRELIPWRFRPFVVEVAREIDDVMGHYVRGQVTVIVILAVLYSIGYAIVGVRLALLIGVIAGLLSFIPYIGGAISLALALLMTFLNWTGWPQLVGVLVVYVVLHVVEGFVLTPKIMGDKLGLASIWVMLALLAGGELFGFLGVLLAMPAAAVMKVFVVRALRWYRESEMFKAGAPAEAELAAAAVPAGAAAAAPVEAAETDEQETEHDHEHEHVHVDGEDGDEEGGSSVEGEGGGETDDGEGPDRDNEPGESEDPEDE
jgi:predicted PurR-regulated permease PerM